MVTNDSGSLIGGLDIKGESTRVEEFIAAFGGGIASSVS